MTLISKIRFSVLFLVFLGFTSGVEAQSIDSLKNELEKHKAEDEARVNLLYDLAAQEYVQNGNQEIALQYLDEAEQISQRINFVKGQADSYYLKGIVFRNQGKHDQSEESLLLASKLYKSIGDLEKQSHSHQHIAILYQQKGKHEDAIQYFNKYIQYMEQKGDTSAVSHAFNNIGNSYADLGEFEQALTYYNKAIAGHEIMGNQDGVASTNNNIGTIYLSQSNNPKAFEFFNKAMYLRQSLGDSMGLVHSLNNLGIIYKRQENYDKAIENYIKALQLLSAKKHKREIAQLKSNLGMAYFHKEDYDKALKLLKESLEISSEVNSLNQSAISLNNIGDIYVRKKQFAQARSYYQQAKKIGLQISSKSRLANSYLGISSSYLKENQYDSSLTYALKSKVIATELDLLAHKSDIEDILWQVYKTTGQYEKALESHELFKLYEDSLQNKENIKKITQLEFEYKYKQELESAEQRELELNEKVKTTAKDLEKSQQNSLIAVIIILLVLLISVIVIFVLKLRHARAKNQIILIEQKLLRSQMTPHFIFNSLSVLQSMILKKEGDQSIQYLSEFSKLLRTILENSRHKSVALSRELMAVDSFIKLQNLDTNPPYLYKLSIDSNINADQIHIPPMLIQPFIENAIEHAFPHQRDNKQIHVSIAMENGKLVCTIDDNGIGIDKRVSEKKNKSSLATVITSERLEILSKEFKSEGALSIINKASINQQGTEVKMTIPYKIEQKA